MDGSDLAGADVGGAGGGPTVAGGVGGAVCVAGATGTAGAAGAALVGGGRAEPGVGDESFGLVAGAPLAGPGRTLTPGAAVPDAP